MEKEKGNQITYQGKKYFIEYSSKEFYLISKNGDFKNVFCVLKTRVTEPKKG